MPGSGKDKGTVMLALVEEEAMALWQAVVAAWHSAMLLPPDRPQLELLKLYCFSNSVVTSSSWPATTPTPPSPDLVDSRLGDGGTTWAENNSDT